MRISDWSSDGALPIYRAAAYRLPRRRVGPCARISGSLYRALPRDERRGDRARPGVAAGRRVVGGVGLCRRAIPARQRTVLRRDLRGERPDRDRRDARTRRSGAALSAGRRRSEEHTSELQSLMRNSYAVFCLKKKTNKTTKRYKQEA